ncbi:MAG: BrnT family toxin [Patescibacteria group bacterium]
MRLTKPPKSEPRWYALGKTNEGRLLFLAFTIRHEKIRIISARDMSKHERQAYAKA